MNAKINTQLVILFLLAAGTAMAQEHNGQERPAPPTGADFVERLDVDGDGSVSESEFDGPVEHFAHLDANGDGQLSEEEAPKGPPPKQQQEGQEGEQSEQEQGERPEHVEQQRPEGGEYERPERGEAQSEERGFASRLDQDGDGQVSESEFDGPAEHFSELDKNSDGFISEEEAPAGPPPRGRRK